MENEFGRLVEMMGKLNPDFKMNEATPTFNSSFTDNTQQSFQPQQKPKNGDVKAYDKTQQQTKSLNKKAEKIDTVIEFPEAFKVWFSKLGYSPDKKNITITKVLSEIGKAMIELGYK